MFDTIQLLKDTPFLDEFFWRFVFCAIIWVAYLAYARAKGVPDIGRLLSYAILIFLSFVYSHGFDSFMDIQTVEFNTTQHGWLAIVDAIAAALGAATVWYFMSKKGLD